MTAPLSDSKGAAIVDEITEIMENYGAVGNLQIPAKAILAILAQEVKRVIGADETLADINSDSKALQYAGVRNKLRAEQRRKAGLV